MSTKITYNGKTTDVPSGYIATIPCKDFKMATDVVVEAPEPAETPTVEEWDGSGVVIEGLVKLISFTVAGAEFQAEEGMTWAQWIDSEYNTDGYEAHPNLGTDTEDSKVPAKNQYCITYNSSVVSFGDLIIANASYGLQYETGGGGAN